MTHEFYPIESVLPDFSKEPDRFAAIQKQLHALAIGIQEVQEKLNTVQGYDARIYHMARDIQKLNDKMHNIEHAGYSA